MESQFAQYIALCIIILALVMLANKLRLAYPIILVLGGLALSFTKLYSNITIDPDLVFFIFLPPLLYEAAWQVSWKEFWRLKRVIFSFAFPIVILTSCVIALVSNALIPGFTLALGFLLGGIISPPDAISATAIMRRLSLPKTLMSVAEGESLLNDASSLIVFRFALVAVITGQFHFSQALSGFFLVIFMGIAIGLVIGLLFYAIHRWLPTTTSIETVLSIVTPYCMYYAAEHFHYSGVLAVVSGGLLLSSKRLTMLNYESRIQGVNVWANLVFLLNGIIFLLIGLALPGITQQLGDTSLGAAIGYGLAISAVLILTRVACTLGASAFTRFMSRFITVADANPGWRGPLILGWSGMRGVVSLAAALSVPILVNGGQPFPYRNLILFITFVVILITLVFQGLTLPWLIRKLNFGGGGDHSEHEQELFIQKKLAEYSLQFLNGKGGAEGQPVEYLENLTKRLQLDLKYFDDATDGEGAAGGRLKSFQNTYLELLAQQRTLLHELNRDAKLDEDLLRKYLGLIDLEELKLRGKLIG